MKINQFIEKIVAEASLDSRIPSGVVDLKNSEHVQVVAETMYDMCENEEIVNEFVNAFINEGKYPDRQAFNKEGWLVTFPSKDYRDAALKKGTHSVSDPTHGKGGMNLYYKRKGKQKRQTQQTQSTTKPTEPTQRPAPEKTKILQQPSIPVATQKDQPRQATKAKTSPLVGPEEVGDEESLPPQKTNTKTPEKSAAPSEPSEPTQAPEAPKPTEAPAIDVPVVTEPPAQYADISKKFATKKGWMAEPYGEYRDAEGNTVAVVGLSGEAVPVKSNDREEYKLFAEKSQA